MATLRVPVPGGGLVTFTASDVATAPPPGPAPRSRVLYAAAHVVPDPFADVAPGRPAQLDLAGVDQG